MQELFNLFLNLTQSLGYPGIVILMAIESSFIPFPSEIVIPPAAFLASQGQMNIYLVVVCGIIGSLTGAIFNYYIALYLGRAIIFKLTEYRFFKLLLLNKKNIEKAEQYFLKYGNISTFSGRLLPGIRQLISLPAGFSIMNLKSFVFYTFLGSALWTIILAFLGYQFGANQQLLKLYYKEISYSFLLLITILIVVFLVYKKFNKKNKSLL
jgi:membrane protein DedA with SNARE-associated domain